MLHTTSLKQAGWIQIPAAAATVAAMLVLPFLVHLIPLAGPVPIGARLLPIFYAPLVAVAFFHPGVALVASLVTPAINYALTGQPAAPIAISLTVELVIFSAVALLVQRRWPRFWLVGPVAYAFARIGSLVLAGVQGTTPWAALPAAWLNGLLVALPGLLILTAISFWLSRR
ncbi:MAG: hypothetical protein H3C34_25325 [Caldilineaceae bacterium]|nr:hypothetical protein [Caldilineaceae bacterium]